MRVAKKGFTLIEVVISLIIFSIVILVITLGPIRLNKNIKVNKNLFENKNNILNLKNAFNKDTNNINIAPIIEGGSGYLKINDITYKLYDNNILRINNDVKTVIARNVKNFNYKDDNRILTIEFNNSDILEIDIKEYLTWERKVS